MKTSAKQADNVLMWLQYHNDFYCSLSLNYTACKVRTYQFDYFAFLEDSLKDIQSMTIDGFGVERRFIMVTPAEYHRLMIFDRLKIDNINIKKYKN